MSAFRRLPWRKPGATREAMLRVGPLPHDLFRATGALDFAPETTPKQKAIQLLHAAVEVEHQFVVQYLYAWFCGGSALGGDFVNLFRIAKEEMGHLLTVQNLLAMLGEPPYLERLLEIPSDEEPSPFHLEPLSLPFVARFLVAESRDGSTLPPDIAQHLPPDLPLEQIHRVGAIYAALYWLFQSADDAEGPWMIPLGSDTSALDDLGHLADGDFADSTQVGAAMNVAAAWHAVDKIANPVIDILVLPPNDFHDVPTMRADALSTIHLVAGQGEGPVEPPPGTPEPSHAARLRGLYDALNTGGAGQPSPFPIDPYTTPRTDNPATEPNLISHAEAREKADAFDRQYEKVLLQIALSAASPPDRAQAAHDAIQTMHTLGAMAVVLTALPRNDANATQLAAPPFTFPAQGIPGAVADIKARLAQIP